MPERLTFDHLCTLYSAWAYDAAAGEASLRMTDAAVAKTLAIILAEGNLEDAGLTLLQGNTDAPLLGQDLRFAVGPPRTGLGIFAPTVDALLRNPKARTQEPARVFVVDAAAPAVANAVVLYRDTLRLVALFAEAAAYLDRDQAQLVFIHDGKFIVPVDYAAADLARIDRVALDQLIAAFNADLHREQKLAILAETVIELTATASLDDRFATLLAQLPKLQERFFRGYRLFASNFSYEKVKSELEEARLRYTTKIHEALTGIQSQLLAIPVATIVVATQLKAAPTVDAAFWGNTAVLVGCWVFFVLVQLLIHNQSQTLSVIETEIARQETVMRGQFPDANAAFGDVFSSLRTRAAAQHRVLGTVKAILIIGLLLAHTVYVAVTDPAQQGLGHLLQFLALSGR